MSFLRNCVLLHCEAGLQDVHEECLFSVKDVWSLITVHNFHSYVIVLAFPMLKTLELALCWWHRSSSDDIGGLELYLWEQAFECTPV